MSDDDAEHDPVDVAERRRRSSLYVMAGSVGPKSLPRFWGRPPRGRSPSPQTSAGERRLAYAWWSCTVLVLAGAAWAYLAGHHAMAGYILLAYFCAAIALSLLVLVVAGLIALLTRGRRHE